MPEAKKQNIYIKIAELEPIPLQIKPENEATYRYAERLVNELWFKWMQMFENKCTSEEVMAVCKVVCRGKEAKCRGGDIA